MKLFKIREMSVPGAIILSAILISITIFVSTFMFFGGPANKMRLVNYPQIKRPMPPSAEQIKKLQEQREAKNNIVPTPTTGTTPATQ